MRQGRCDREARRSQTGSHLELQSAKGCQRKNVLVSSTVSISTLSNTIVCISVYTLVRTSQSINITFTLQYWLDSYELAVNTPCASRNERRSNLWKSAIPCYMCMFNGKSWVHKIHCLLTGVSNWAPTPTPTTTHAHTHTHAHDHPRPHPRPCPRPPTPMGFYGHGCNGHFLGGRRWVRRRKIK